MKFGERVYLLSAVLDTFAVKSIKQNLKRAWIPAFAGMTEKIYFTKTLL